MEFTRKRCKGGGILEQIFVLTLNGLATGMLIFLIAAGLSLIFGLMDVLNFSHGALSMWGAYVGLWIYTGLDKFWLQQLSGFNTSPWYPMVNILDFFLGILGGIFIGAVLGWLVEKYMIRPVYGNHVQQILITMGVMLVLSEAIKLFWGSNLVAAPVPLMLDGSWQLGSLVIIKYRLTIIIIGLIVLGALYWLMQKTKIGLYVRAGVQNKEIVETLGINVRKVFTLVFILGASLAALGGMLMGPFMNQVYPSMGIEKQLLAFIVVVIGGMGSIFGSAVAGMIVGISEAFMLYFIPDAALAVNVLLMAIVLLIKPSGLFGERG